ncbi:Pleckstrin domain-like protein [Ophiocordyceps camponoti-floridani]|uniref:Pleckstrin domain-like protein n=1 Tax=Ophiocordyceps camponoti-floridani TaxID=2030778 RepID=A0A8H4QA26_9HYPO|nr:Pleckstrin domain-like protein [Ophiocordyceps camponoti-floridani]
MAEEQKPTVDVPEAVKTDVAAVEQPAASEPTASEPVATAESKLVDEPKPAETTEAAEATKTEAKKEEAKPVEEGYLAHKAQGASFPKNLIPSKEFFFFGSDAVEPKHLAHYQKSEKSSDDAHDNIAWASHTGKGLLFLGDKKAPHGVINLANATEPEVDGSHKFHFTSKGNKHSFKANSTPERDSWIAQLKLKIAEAKELASNVTESETYKKTLETFKPVPVTAAAKEEKSTEEAAKPEESAQPEDAPKDAETSKDEVKDEEPKRRSASRKRASFFAFGGGKKEDKKEDKKDEAKADAAPAVAAAAAAAEPATETEEAPAAEVAAPATDEIKTVEEATPAESPKEKQAPSKRNSFFGGVFSKKEKKTTEAKPVEESTEAATESELPPTDATAPVIPPVESTTPLAVDVSNPATVPTENIETAAATTTGEAKKDVKEKRKSSLPFAFGKRDKSPVPGEGDDKDKAGMSAFSKLRATIKGKSAAKPEEKLTEESVKGEAAAAAAASKDTSAATDAAKETGEAVPETSAAATTEPENKPENVASATPAVTAAA